MEIKTVLRTQQGEGKRNVKVKGIKKTTNTFNNIRLKRSLFLKIQMARGLLFGGGCLCIQNELCITQI